MEYGKITTAVEGLPSLYVLTKKSIKLIIEEYGSYQFHENYRSR
jgi:hypothetical protein